MTTRKQEEESGVKDETLVAPDQSSIQGQKSLSDLLDEIEQRTLSGIGWAELLTSRNRERMALVKALRRANEIISECDPDTVFWWTQEVTGLLREPAEEKK